MKRFLLIIILFILCGTVSMAQSKQDEYNKLVDYVNCKYTVDYINGKKSEIKNKGYINDFEKYKKAFISNVNSYSDIYNGIDKTIQNSTPIYDALKKTAKGFPKAKELWQLIDDKKVNFNSDWTKEQMIDYLILLSDDLKISNQKIDFKLFLQATTKSLKKDLNKQIFDNLFESKKEIADETSATNKTDIKKVVTAPTTDLDSKFVEKALGTEQVKDNNRKERSHDINKGKSKLPFGNIIIVVLLAVLGYFVYNKRGSVKNLFNRFKSNSAKKEEPSDFDYQKKYKEIQLENLRLKKSFEQENAQLRTSNKQLEQRITELKRQRQQKTEPTKEQSQSLVIPVKKEEKQVKLDAIRLYADAIIDGEFHRIKEQPNEDTVFELILTPISRTASFQIYHESYRRVIKNPDFVDGCEKQKINPQPQNLEVENGEAAQDDFGKWKVTKKAIIKFE